MVDVGFMMDVRHPGRTSTDRLLAVVHNDLKARVFAQLASLFEEQIGSVDAASDLAMGLAAISAALAEVGLTPGAIDSCRSEATPLRFLHGLGDAIASGFAIGRNIDAAFFRDSDARSGPINAEINLFVRLLDGVVDDAPYLLSEIRPALDALLLSRESYYSDPDLQGLARLTVTLGRHWIEALRGAARNHNNGLERQIDEALAAAYVAELASKDVQAMSDKLPDVLPCIQAIRAKSSGSIRVVLLAAIAFNSRPVGLTDLGLSELAEGLGGYFSLVDDLADLVTDTIEGRWNEVSLNLVTKSSAINAIPAAAWRQYLLGMIGDEDLAEEVAGELKRCYLRATAALVAAGGDPVPLSAHVGWATRDWLRGGDSVA